MTPGGGQILHGRHPALRKEQSQDPKDWIPRLHCVARGMTVLRLQERVCASKKAVG